MIKTATQIMQKIADLGYSCLIVGGAVRDFALGQNPHDIDLATNCPVDVIKANFRTSSIGESENFGIITIIEGNDVFEIAQFRTDLNCNGRKMDGIAIVSDFREDASRRDFTINAMGMDVNGKIIDYFNGIQDLKNKILNTVGVAEERFAEDYLRIIRAVRFSAKMGFSLSQDIIQAIKKLAHNIPANISRERISSELFKVAGNGKQLANFIQTLFDLDIMQFVFPELCGMANMPHNEESHPEGNVLDHTLSALRASNGNDIANLCTLFHDFEKMFTYSFTNGKHTYHNHDTAVNIINFSRKYRFTAELTNAIVFCIEKHMAVHSCKNSKLAAMMQDKNFNVLVEVVRNDIMSRAANQDWMTSCNAEFDALQARINTLVVNTDVNPVDAIKKRYNGDYIMSLTGCKPGKHIGQIIALVVSAIIDNGISIDDQDTINSLIKDNI